MPEDTKEVILEKTEDSQSFDESLSVYAGEEGQAPSKDEEFATLPNELPSEQSTKFSFTRESAPKEVESTFEKAEEKKEELPWYKDKKFLSLVALSSGVCLVLIFVLMYLSFRGDNIKPDIIATKSKKQSQDEIDNGAYKGDEAIVLDNIIQKANSLYSRGEIKEALKIYEKVAIYSEALSSYNLGVLKMSEEKFEEAIESFEEAIKKGEARSVSAINAAVSSLKLGDRQRFKYYLDLAQDYITKEGKSELYNYYLSLINYYKGYYIEALQMLLKVDVEPYGDSAKYLLAKIYTKLGANARAIDMLNSQQSFESSLSLGLLHAKLGEYDKARSVLSTAMKVDRDFNESLSALSIIDIKTGNYQDMIERLNSAYAEDKYKYQILDKYKIKVRLKKELYSINLAQEKFSRDLLQNYKDQFDLLFYFAPYQVFNTKQALLYIKKANVITVDDRGASDYLNAGKNLSSVNIRIARAINEVYNNKLKNANDDFQKILKGYSEHSILHYNLALTYAQLQNYKLAYKHFLTSYNLNPKNYLAGAFAIFCGKIINEDTKKLYGEIMENITNDDENAFKLEKTMLFLGGSSFVSMLPFLEEEKPNSALTLMLEAIAARLNGLKNEENNKIAKLKNLLPGNIITNILYFNSLNEGLDIKEYSQNAQIYFIDAKLDYKDLFGSPNIVKEHYAFLLQATGILNLEIKKFKNFNSMDANVDGEDVLRVLAYLNILGGNFAEANKNYNVLIDIYKVEDSEVYFLAAMASLGINAPNSSIILLQLSRIQDPNNQEVQAALALLYQEVKNYKNALNQYKNLPNDLESHFFTFDIVPTGGGG